MKALFRLIILSTLCIYFVSSAQAQAPARKGWWKFDDAANLLKAEPGFGSDLELVGSHQASAGPVAGNGAVRIGRGSYYKMTHGISANGGGSYVNEYSLQIDFKISTQGLWHCFFQTNPANSNDGDCFINPGGNIGVAATGYADYVVKPNEWYRLVISVKNGAHYRYYLDGQLVLNGIVQSVDGRFALDNTLLMFADEDGEDGEIDCAELAIWDRPLTDEEVKQLGGYGHATGQQQLMLVPYLQTPTPTSIFVCWHDTAALTKVEYGTTPALGQTATGASEVISAPYRWHTVKLTGLQSDTEYHYRVVSGSGASTIYSFRTQPEAGATNKLRFVLLSDTHSSDTTMAVKVIKAVKAKIGELYGADIRNHLNAVLHSGDLVVSGNSIGQYTGQYFAPMAPLSPYVPFMTVTGNHEIEHEFYYKYFKYDEVSAFPTHPGVNERFWWLRIANTVIIGLNTNIVQQSGTLQKAWLDLKLQEIENDPAIDFVFIMFHHPPFTELWVEALTYDAGPNYVNYELMPIIKKYSKVQQLSYGHTHAFERGTIESNKADGDFRIVCGGGGGGDTDRWGEFTNRDYPQIHVSLDHYFFQILEIDVVNKSWEAFMYSLGNSSKARSSQLMDRWHRKLNQPSPDRPSAFLPLYEQNKVIFPTSPFSGSDSLMTVRIQVGTDSSFATTTVDTMVHWKNVYGADANFEPIDKNKGLDLTRLSFSTSRFASGKTYYYRVKYRDHNLKWSGWSNPVAFGLPTGIEERAPIPTDYELGQNYPNPFNPSTIIAYQTPRRGHVSIKIYNSLGQEVSTLVNEVKEAGSYQVEFNAVNLSSGMYYYEMRSGGFTAQKKFSLTK